MYSVVRLGFVAVLLGSLALGDRADTSVPKASDPGVEDGVIDVLKGAGSQDNKKADQAEPPVKPKPKPAELSCEGAAFNCDDKNPCPDCVVGDDYHFPHEDPTKFVQCDDYGNCYMVPCPPGLEFDDESNTCKPPVETFCDGEDFNCGDKNPCLECSVDEANSLFPHEDPSKVVMCNSFGHCHIESCPPGLEFNWVSHTCTCPSGLEFNFDSKSCESSKKRRPRPAETSCDGEDFNCDDKNPCFDCTGEGDWFFPHEDPTKFVQCTEHGQCYIMSCPPGFEFDDESNECKPPVDNSCEGENFNCDDKNPCPECTAEGDFHFPHEDPTKFVQCDSFGGCFIMSCPPGLEFDDTENRCK